MPRLLATAVRADTGEFITIELGRLDEASLVGAKTRALVLSDFFRQVWFAAENGSPTFVVKNNLGSVPSVMTTKEAS